LISCKAQERIKEVIHIKEGIQFFGPKSGFGIHRARSRLGVATITMELLPGDMAGFYQTVEDDHAAISSGSASIDSLRVF